MFIITEKSKKIIELYHEGKSYKEIASLTNSSFTQIKKVIDKEKRAIFHNEVVRMWKEGKTFEEISIELDLSIQEIKIMIDRHITSNTGDWLRQFYNELINSSINPQDFLEFSYTLFQKKFTVQTLERLNIFQQDLDDRTNHFNHLINENLRLEKTNSYQEQKIFDQNKVINNNEIEIKKIQVEKEIATNELTKIKTKLNGIKELYDKIKQDPSYVKPKQELLEKLGRDEFLSEFAGNLLELFYYLLTPMKMYDKSKKQYYDLTNVDFKTFRQEFSDVYKSIIFNFCSVIKKYYHLEK